MYPKSTFSVVLRRCALCVAPILFCLVLSGCALLRLPLPVVPFEINVLDDETIPGLPRLFDGNVEGRPGVIGLVLPLPYLCDLAPLELVTRAYIDSLESEYIGELSNNILVNGVRIRQVRLKAERGRLDFIAEAGIRFVGKDEDITYWSNFTDRDERNELIFTPDGDFNLFDLIPGENECIGVDLLYSGSYPESDVRITMDITIEILADWQF